MKKIITLILALVMCFALCACGNGKGNSSQSQKTSENKFVGTYESEFDWNDRLKVKQVLIINNDNTVTFTSTIVNGGRPYDFPTATWLKDELLFTGTGTWTFITENEIRVIMDYKSNEKINDKDASGFNKMEDVTYDAFDWYFNLAGQKLILSQSQENVKDAEILFESSFFPFTKVS